jgi:hypothetical protein
MSAWPCPGLDNLGPSGRKDGTGRPAWVNLLHTAFLCPASTGLCTYGVRAERDWKRQSKGCSVSVAAVEMVVSAEVMAVPQKAALRAALFPRSP